MLLLNAGWNPNGGRLLGNFFFLNFASKTNILSVISWINLKQSEMGFTWVHGTVFSAEKFFWGYLGKKILVFHTKKLEITYFLLYCPEISSHVNPVRIKTGIDNFDSGSEKDRSFVRWHISFAVCTSISLQSQTRISTHQGALW